LRIITGKAKGHKIKAPKGLVTRPTTDRVKESIFNILGGIPEESIVLDLFSGSGNIGIEFLSRGAKACYFIDNNVSSIKVIKENLENTRFTEQALIYKTNVENAITVLGKKGTSFSYIFMDPPYEKNMVIPILESIFEKKLLKSDGIIIVEHEAKYILPDNINSFKKTDSRKYGATTVSFFRIEEV